MVSTNGVMVYAKSKALYHGILFASFVVAVLLADYIKNLVVTNLAQYPWSHWILPFIVMYVLAIYALPEIGFLIAKPRQ